MRIAHHSTTQPATLTQLALMATLKQLAPMATLMQLVAMATKLTQLVAMATRTQLATGRTASFAHRLRPRLHPRPAVRATTLSRRIRVALASTPRQRATQTRILRTLPRSRTMRTFTRNTSTLLRMARGGPSTWMSSPRLSLRSRSWCGPTTSHSVSSALATASAGLSLG